MEAEALHKKALAIREKALGPDHPYVAESLVELASTCEKQNRLAEALPLVERAREIFGKGNVAPIWHAQAAFVLARVRWALGKDRARASSLAQEALELFKASGPGAEKRRREVERWLAEHRRD